MLSVGIGGSGRQSAAKLAAFMADYELFMIEITRNYTTTEWREDLKKVSFVLFLIHVDFIELNGLHAESYINL